MYGVLYIILCLLYLRYARPYINEYVPFTLSRAPFPVLSGYMAIFDLFIGTLLVAYSEELIFRRILLINVLNFDKGAAFAVMSSGIIFGLHHFLRDASSILFSILAGIVFMMIYLSSGTLGFVVIIHFIIDFIPTLYYYDW